MENSNQSVNDPYDFLDADYQEYIERIETPRIRRRSDKMKEMAKVNVLGTEYTIFINVTERDKPYMKGNDGIADFTTKEIYIAPIDDGDPMNMQNMSVYENRTIRHEIVHAFLFESGLDHNTEWARNEEIVDWIAIQAPKLFNVFEKMKVQS
ncbi:hypothetical protein M4I17_09760 [Enterococcus thailandicus]|uniref:hypothetical protein n=1 Tax=Enterococcus thailandicus TaxID=417368 RepID=UPI002543E167|nr:hypothetical protein [Enterococcus thailandicus]MDK4352683.1 hypothetical protein [Enterococcus thailandicus]MDT2735403.1 hypothetical protein [Enterococcus thailandicus]